MAPGRSLNRPMGCIVASVVLQDKDLSADRVL